MDLLDEHLQHTSRTFALSIPRLPSPARETVTVGYLLFRIADTFEDAAAWPRDARRRALDDFAALLDGSSREGPAALGARWADARPTEHAGYLSLLRATGAVFAAFDALPDAAREIVRRHALRTTLGMRDMVDRSDVAGSLSLRSVDDLRAYCYLVAGIVGELLTDLFLALTPSLAREEGPLRACAVAFGEGLQLVNILKDAADDARDGRVYLPPDAPRDAVIAMARRDLGLATRYVLALQSGGAPRGYVEFTALPVLLARAALGEIEDRGAGAKVSRADVMSMVSSLDARLDRGEPALDG